MFSNPTNADSRLNPIRASDLVVAAIAVGLLTPTRAIAANLSGPITGWASGVPSYVSMFEYVPDKLAANPPILVVSHYCGGNASAMYGQAQGGQVVAAADKYGFILIFPQTSNNCWDVGSTKSLTHDGGGDTQAIAEMVKYAIAKHNGNPNRVYAAGTSSGAMMTEALLAVYPDVFKAGGEFSGVPAGCWAVGDPNGSWSSACAGGMVTHTPQEWGDIVRGMYKGYSGYRPRIQLWHGTMDMTINFQNQDEAVKEWTNVLGLGLSPTSMTTVMFKNATWTRRSWTDSCGFTVLDAWDEQGGPHNTDAPMNATYLIPFLGLDQIGATDPRVAQCGGGMAGSGGSSGAGGGGGSSGSGGTGGTNAGSNGGSTASGSGSGGGGANGGSLGSAGAPSPGGSNGVIGSGGASAMGGVPAADNGGAIQAMGGANSAGVPTAPGETAGVVSNGAAASDSNGCNCALGSNDSPRHVYLRIGLFLGLAISARRRRRASAARRHPKGR